MMIRYSCLLLLAWLINFCGCSEPHKTTNQAGQPVYEDVPYLQDYAVKFYTAKEDGNLMNCYTDRNQVIQILTSKGLFRPDNGSLQHPGTIEPDRTYRPMAGKAITDMTLYQDQFVYLDGRAILSNAWAGKLYSRHDLSRACLLCPGKDFGFLISDGNMLAYQKDNHTLWQEKVDGQKILDIRYDDDGDEFIILAEKTVYRYSATKNKLESLYDGGPFTCFDLSEDGRHIILGSMNGYRLLDRKGASVGEIQQRLPWPELTAVKEIDGRRWFGSTRGAFMQRDDGRFNYYFGERWLPGAQVIHIARGPDHSILILTDGGLGQICFRQMTLEDKALFYEQQVRQRQIRYGINSNVTRLTGHDLSSAENFSADSDNLWTAMYLGSQLFRYLVTGSTKARQNCYEAFEAMERLHTINDIRGLFGRSFERRGYQTFRREFRDYVNDFWYDGYQGGVGLARFSQQ